MTVFRVSPQLFFFIGLSAVLCANIAIYVVKISGGIKVFLRHEILKWIFFVYLLLLLSYSLFPVSYEVSLFDPSFKPSGINFVPFRTIIETFSVFDIAKFSLFFKLKTTFLYIFGNLFSLIPFGFLLPQLHKKLRTAITCFFAALAVSCGISFIQFIETSFDFAADRAVSVDNVLLSVAGALVGFYAWHALRKKYC